MYAISIIVRAENICCCFFFLITQTSLVSLKPHFLFVSLQVQLNYDQSLHSVVQDEPQFAPSFLLCMVEVFHLSKRMKDQVHG